MEGGGGKAAWALADVGLTAVLLLALAYELALLSILVVFTYGRGRGWITASPSGPRLTFSE